MPQPGANRNGVRPYLQVHMPTFNFSPNELRVLVRFFMAVSSQNDPYIKEPMDPMTESEKSIARNIFVSGTPCLKCHITGEPTHDAKGNCAELPAGFAKVETRSGRSVGCWIRRRSLRARRCPPACSRRIRIVGW